MSNNIIDKAVAEGRKTLSEYESKKLLADYGVPIVAEDIAGSVNDAAAIAENIGWPVAMKACGTGITHKTEKKLIELNIDSPQKVAAAYAALAERAGEGLEGVLVQEMIPAGRELVVGLIRDKTFGPCVMFGIGGIYTEVFRDVTFRVAPLEKRDASEMIGEIRGAAILGAFRGMPEVDRGLLAEILIGIGRIGIEQDKINEIDINPLIIDPVGAPVAVDALVAVKQSSATGCCR